MKKTYCFNVMLSILSFVSLFILNSEASAKIDLTESVFLKQMTSETFLASLQDIEGLTYQLGSRGRGVKEFQNLLMGNGYTSIGKADGKYGNKTVFAVKEFQESANLPVTGKADLATQLMLVLQDNSSVHTGNIYTAKKHNYVVNFWPEKAFYIGAVDEIGTFIEGTYYYSTGDYYAGEYKNNLRSGKGTGHFSNGDVYIGQWKDDTMNGAGVYYYGGINSTEYYKGNMINNTMNGKGTYYLDGKKITGQWLNNTHTSWK